MMQTLKENEALLKRGEITPLGHLEKTVFAAVDELLMELLKKDTGLEELREILPRTARKLGW